MSEQSFDPSTEREALSISSNAKMNTIRNYCQQFSSIDWNKQTRETLLPSAAGLATGALVNYDNPTVYAVSHLFRRGVVSSFDALDASGSLQKLMYRIFPSTAGNPLAFEIGYHVLLNVSTVFASCKLAELVGYPISLRWAMGGTFLGEAAHDFVEFDLARRLVQKSAAKDPFAESEILTVTKDTFQKEVLESDLPVVLDVYATWCPPCKYMLPIFTEVSREWAGKVKFVKVNADEEEELADTLNIQAFPTFVFFKEGKTVGTQRGGAPREFFGEKFKELFEI